MSFSDFLFQGQPLPAAQSSGTTIPSLPDWYQQYLKGTAAQALAATGQPYTPYGGPRIAPFTPAQLSAFDLAQSGVGAGQADVSQAKDMTTAASTYDPNALQQFMSPYTSGVLDVIAQRGARNLSENLLPQVNTTFTGAGQFGSTRNADFTARAVRDTNQSILQQQALSAQQALQDAQNQYGAWAGRGLMGAQELASLAGTGRAMTAQDVATQEAVGQTQQDMAQKSMDLAYQDFLRQQGYPLTQAQELASLGQYAKPSGGTTTTYSSGTGYAPSPLSALAGLYGLYQGATQ